MAIDKPSLWFARIAVLLAAALGILTLLAHSRQPDLPSIPGRGCLTTSIFGPDSTRIPPSHLEFESCLHISETIYTLNYLDASEEGNSFTAFTATGPEGPDQWNKHVQVRWPNRDTLIIVVDQDVKVENVVRRRRGMRVILERKGED